MKTLLRSLTPSLEVLPSSSHGENDCLTDSILLALEDQGAIVASSALVRQQLCRSVRRYLEIACHLPANGFPFLSHDAHFASICHMLRCLLERSWRGEAPLAETSFTCIVQDRFNRQVVVDNDGTRTELAETNPVYSRACGAETFEVILMLYCNTHEDGEGWHYEWIHVCEERPESLTIETGMTSPKKSPTDSDELLPCSGLKRRRLPDEIVVFNDEFQKMTQAGEEVDEWGSIRSASAMTRERNGYGVHDTV